MRGTQHHTKDTMIQLTQLRSSNLRAAGHEPATNLLAVHFTNGSVFHYKDVPSDVASKLLQADSPGKYFAAEIRGKYPAEKVVAEEQTAQA